MTGTEGWLIVGVVLLGLVASAFAGAEAAISRVSRVRVEDLTHDGRRGADRLAHVLADPARYLNLVLLLRIVCELAATVLVTVLFINWLGEGWAAVAAAVGLMVVVSYVAVGVSPRALGRRHAERVALSTAGAVYHLARVLGPLAQLLVLLGNVLTPGVGFRDQPFTTEAELRDLVDLAEERQVIQAGERQMIHSVFDLSDTIVREVMVPRTDIVFMERDKTLGQALSLGLRSGFSRIPVVGRSEDDVVGIAYLKDVIRRIHEYRDGESVETVESVMRPAPFVPDSKPVDGLLREMQARQIHLAIVVDEYGGTAGLVTIEDILETIVGEIADEHDRESPRVEHLPDGSVRVTARLSVQDLGEIFGVDIYADDVETVGGLLAQALGRVPIAGSEAEVAGLTLSAENLAGRRNRIGTVLVRRVKTASVAPEYEEEAEPLDARARS
ncbi:MAG: hemolysin family protein [Streptosporangiaceae bacterium]